MEGLLGGVVGVEQTIGYGAAGPKSVLVFDALRAGGGGRNRQPCLRTDVQLADTQRACPPVDEVTRQTCEGEHGVPKHAAPATTPAAPTIASAGAVPL